MNSKAINYSQENGFLNMIFLQRYLYYKEDQKFTVDLLDSDYDYKSKYIVIDNEFENV